MFETYLWLTGIVIGCAMLMAYAMAQDPLHPLMFLGPMFFYIHVLIPGAHFYRGVLPDYFVEPRILDFAQLVILVSMTAFCLGCLRIRVGASIRTLVHTPLHLTESTCKRLQYTSYLLAAIGLASFMAKMAAGGGFVEMYSRAKGGGGMWGLSGYIASAPLLTIPAIMFYMLSLQGRRFRPLDMVTVLLYASPQLIQGFLGGSRGNLFITAATVALGWYLASSRRPSFSLLMMGVIILGSMMLFIKAYRRQIYIGSEFEIETKPVMEILLPEEVATSDVSVYTLAHITAMHTYRHHYWGRRYFVQLFVRPIPRHWWPTKYEDMGMDELINAPGKGGLNDQDWRSLFGWIPQTGSAVGLIADTFAEFSWAGCLVCYLMGWVYGTLWKKAVLDKGLWAVIYLYACVVSVYLPTQGLISAWSFRFLYLTLPTIALWNVVVYIRERKRSRQMRLAAAMNTPAAAGEDDLFE